MRSPADLPALLPLDAQPLPRFETATFGLG